MFNNERLREVRLSLGVTQKEMAQSAGIQQGSYADIERGKTQKISTNVAKVLKEKYRINLDYLYNESDVVFIEYKEGPSERAVLHEQKGLYANDSIDYWKGATAVLEKQLSAERELVKDVIKLLKK